MILHAMVRQAKADLGKAKGLKGEKTKKTKKAVKTALPSERMRLWQERFLIPKQLEKAREKAREKECKAYTEYVEQSKPNLLAYTSRMMNRTSGREGFKKVVCYDGTLGKNGMWVNKWIDQNQSVKSLRLLDEFLEERKLKSANADSSSITNGNSSTKEASAARNLFNKLLTPMRWLSSEDNC